MAFRPNNDNAINNNINNPPPVVLKKDNNDDDQTVIGGMQAFYTQSDWSGRVCRETWYGKHSPWRRIFAFAVLSSWTLTFSWLVSLYTSEMMMGDLKFPILAAVNEQELTRIKDSHEACFFSFCEDIALQTPISCVVNEDGVSARVEFGDENTDPSVDNNSMPQYIFFPEACHVATETTFGYRYLAGDDELGTKPVVFLTIQTEEFPANATVDATKQQQQQQPSLLTLLPDCSVTISTTPEMSPEEIEAIKKRLNVDGREWEQLFSEFTNNNNNQQQQDPNLGFSLSFNLLGLPQNANQRLPGYRETFVLKKLLCVEEMPSELQEDVLPALGRLYFFLIHYRHELLAAGISIYHYCLSLLALLWLMMRLVVPTLVVKRLLPWPANIQTVDIWRTLVLLSFISTAYFHTPYLSVVMTLGAWYYHDTRAAMEWAFLGCVAWGAPDVIYPTLNSLVFGLLGEEVSTSSSVSVYYVVQWIIHIFVVGEGWWKLMTLYVYYRSYQALQLTTTRHKRRRRQQPDNVLEQTQMQINHQHRREQYEQEPPAQDHVKVD